MKRITILMAAAAALSLAAGAAQAQQHKWDFATAFAPKTADGVAVAHFVDRVHEKSGGQIAITIHYSASLGYKCPQHLELVESGAVPLATICGDMLGGTEPVFQVTTLPFMARVPKHFRALRESALPQITEVYRKYNQIPLFMYSNTPAGIWAKKPVTTIDSLKNWKVRVWDKNGLDTFTNAGAAAVAMPWVDVLPALSTGTIEGVATAGEAGFRSKFNDYMDHFMTVNFAAGVTEGTINMDTWNDLSPELQQAVKEAGEETTKFAFERMERLVNETYRDMRAAGMTVIEEFSDEFISHLSNAGKPVIDNWLERMGPDGQTILTEFHRRVASM